MTEHGRNSFERRRRFDERRSIESRVARAADEELESMGERSRKIIDRADRLTPITVGQAMLAIPQIWEQRRGRDGQYASGRAPTGSSWPVNLATRLTPLSVFASGLATYVGSTERAELKVIDAEIAARARKRELEDLADRIDPDSLAAPGTAPKPRQDPRSASRALEEPAAAPPPGVRISPGSRLRPRHRAQVR